MDRNHRPFSVGTGGRFEPEQPAVFAGITMKLTVFVTDPSMHVDEALEDGRGMLTFESPQITGEMSVKGIGDHGPQDVEMDSDHKGRGKGVKVKEGDKFGEFVFDVPSFGICFLHSSSLSSIPNPGASRGTIA